MTEINDDKQQSQGTWWSAGVLYLMLTPFVALAYFAFKALGVVWNFFDGTTGAVYAVAVFAICGTLLAAYIVMIVRQIYFEFVLPKLAETRRNKRENQRGK